MPELPKNPIEVARLLADCLGDANIPYAIGGAIAYAYWGIPRATRDVDINIFVGANALEPALNVLEKAGLDFSAKEVIASATERGDAKLYLGDVRVDLFVNSIPFHESAARRVVVRELKGRAANMLSAEDLAVFKLLFFRSKDTVDLERLVAVQQTLDEAYIRRWLVDTVGEEDERVTYWDNLWAAFSSSDK